MTHSRPKDLSLANDALSRAAPRRVVAIMQPYWFPYVGYFQLIGASDVFVLHDDVQYIKGGWVNRNRILLQGRDRMVTLPILKGPHDSPINARHYLTDASKAHAQTLRLVKEAYSKAPYFHQIHPLIEELLAIEDRNVASFNSQSIQCVCDYIGITTPIIASSALSKNNDLAGQQRVLDICKCLGATDYVNPIGGAALYRGDAFRAAGIKLHFLETLGERYRQFGDTWVPSLSIIDVLMFNSVDEVRRLLGTYSVTQPDGNNTPLARSDWTSARQPKTLTKCPESPDAAKRA